MPETQFRTLTLLNDGGGLTVTGPYNPTLTGPQKMVGQAFIGFLILQNDANGDPTIIVDGVATWMFPPAGGPPTGGPPWPDFSLTVPAVELPEGLHVGPVRAVGKAVQFTAGGVNPHDPPVVESVTWCVSQNIVPE